MVFLNFNIMSLKNIALIVDGPTEETSLRKKFEMIYYDCPNLRIGPGNGVTYTTEGYAKGVLPTLVFLLKSNVRAIILIPDLEKRKVSPEIFSLNLKHEIIKLLITSTKHDKDYLEDIIRVCPPNIMFENWIVSDVVNIMDANPLINPNSTQKDYEGKNGTSELQKMMTTKYKKTVHAQSFFKKTNDNISSVNSNSFKVFMENFTELKNKHCP